MLVGLAPGASEGHDPWASFLEDLVDRGLRPPLLVITDGAAGLIGAVELVFSNSLRQRCLVHRCRINLLAKVPTHAQAEVKAAFWQIFDDIDAEPGDQAVAQARQRAHAFADRYDHRYPAAVACLLDTLPELTCFLRFPREHRKRIRHSNLISVNRPERAWRAGRPEGPTPGGIGGGDCGRQRGRDDGRGRQQRRDVAA